MTDSQLLRLALEALRAITRLDESNTTRYIRQCDHLALEAVIAIEHEFEDRGLKA
jgi:hypothetical protein